MQILVDLQVGGITYRNRSSTKNKLNLKNLLVILKYFAIMWHHGGSITGFAEITTIV